MRPFEFTAPGGIPEALRRFEAGSAYLAGGTTLVDLMKLEVVAPGRVLDINALPMRGLRWTAAGLRIGALERMTEVAADRDVAQAFPVLVEALASSASPQVRNMASIGGNLLQRTRCGYFRDVHTPCNKRDPGTGCPALTGENRTHAILGGSTSCVATHASDLAVALVALDASVDLVGRAGPREMRLADLYRLPGDTPHLENHLRPGELVSAVLVPRLPWARRSTYLKIRDRRSFEFALTSVAVALDVRGRTIHQARVAAGGVGTVPWRLPGVEAALRGRPLRLADFEAAAARAVDGARPLGQNRFKIALLQRSIVRALLNLAG